MITCAADMNPAKPWRQRDRGGVYNYIVISDIYALDDYYINQMHTIQKVGLKKLKNIFQAKKGFFGNEKSEDFSPFLLLNFYEMINVKERLQENVNLLFINPLRINNYNLALIANPPLNNVSVDECAFTAAPKGSPVYIPEIARSKAGEIFIINLVDLVKSYEQDFMRTNNFYAQYYPKLS